MLIVDAQVHIWAASTAARPWPERHAPPRPDPLGKDDLLRAMHEAGVDAAFLVPPSWEGDYNDLVIEAVNARPDRFAAMGVLDLLDSQSRGLAAELWRQPGIAGLRLNLRRPPLAQALSAGQLEWFWAEAQEHAIPLMVLVSNQRVEDMARVAGRFPRLRIVLDHLGMVDAEKGREQQAIERVLRLAELPHVAVKATGLPALFDETYPYLVAQSLLRTVLRHYGRERVFWGSDFTRLKCTYRQSVAMVAEAMEGLAEADRAWLLGRAICAWFDWSPAPAPPIRNHQATA